MRFAVDGGTIASQRRRMRRTRGMRMNRSMNHQTRLAIHRAMSLMVCYTMRGAEALSR
jgi:hypothetical protein